MKKLYLFLALFLGLSGMAHAQLPGVIPDIYGKTYDDNAQVRYGRESDFVCSYLTVDTPDTMVCGTSLDSNGILFVEKADIGFDFAHAHQTDPTVFVHSHNQSTSQWISISHNGTNGVIDVGTGKVTFPDGIDAAITGNADTATALAANPTDCSSNQFANAIAANGNLTCAALTDADVPNNITISAGTIDNTVIGGTTKAAGGFTTLTASGAVNFTSTTNIGWSVVSGANTACNTTCTNACVFGQNTADMSIVDCANATADVCVCAGAN